MRFESAAAESRAKLCGGALAISCWLAAGSSAPLLAQPLQGEVKEKATITDTVNRMHRPPSSGNADPFANSGGGRRPEEGKNDTFHAQGNNGASNGQQAVTPAVRPIGRSSGPPPTPATSTKSVPWSPGIRMAPPHVVSHTPIPNVNLNRRTDLKPASARMDPASKPASEPDSEKGLEVLWDQWHQRVAGALYSNFIRRANTQFRSRARVYCKVGYGVSDSGQILNIHMVEASQDPAFDQIVMDAVQSLAGNPVLKFPAQSKRKLVARTGVFTFNDTAKRGFEVQKGDRETIRP